MLVQQNPSWTCKNPRCFTQISFGSYCKVCLKLVIRRIIPDSIICEKCGKEEKVRQLTNELKKKKRFCSVCHVIHNRDRSLEYYYAVTRKKNQNKFLEGNV